MQITSFGFLLFLLGVLLCYFLLPRKFQWVVLLAASLLFYALSGGVKNLLFVLLTSVSVWMAARRMQALGDGQRAYLKGEGKELSREEKAAYKEGIKKQKKSWMLGALLLNLLVLCVFKYLNFLLQQYSALAALFGGRTVGALRLIAPLGISFYTFQMIGYLLDVYWGNVRAEEHYGKTLLFCSFFPQMTQGPISEYGELAGQLTAPHEFSYHNYSWGLQRMAWGFFKKMVVADALAPCVADVFANYAHYSGLTTLIGAFLYSVQIYADFSGYMDIMCGLCEIMGIRLTENFERPYFSKSVAEYWRRWHMSLGAWFKRFIYYPIGISKWNRNLGKVCRARFGKKFGDMLPASVALVIVWLSTGLWHGASWGYIVWGLVNGLFIILTLWLTPVYDGIRAKLGIQENAGWWRAFQVLRTFVLVTFIKVLPEVGTLSQGLGLWGRIFSNFERPGSLAALLPFVNLNSLFSALHFLMACAGTLLMLTVSLLQRRKPIRARTETWPIPVRAAVYAALCMLILTFGVQNSWEGGGFMYAQF